MKISKAYELQVRESQAEAEGLAAKVERYTSTPSDGDTSLADWLRAGAEGNGLEGRTPQEIAQEWDSLS